MLIGPISLFRALAIGVVAAAVLAGCATPSEVVPTDRPGGDSSPSANPSANIDAPEPSADVSCTELLSTASLSAAFGVPVAELDVVRPYARPLRFALRQLGGIECEWSNGESLIAEDGAPNPLYVGVTLGALPDAKEPWHTETGELFSCSEVTETVRCLVSALVGPDFLTLDLQGAADVIGNGAKAEAVTRSMYEEFSAAWTAALSAARASSTVWEAPTGTVPLNDRECGQIVSLADAAAIFGASAPGAFQAPFEDRGVRPSPEEKLGAGFCVWLVAAEREEDYTENLQGVVLSWLPGGEWAWLESPRRSSSEAIEVPGLSPNDSAWLECPTPTGACVLDLVVGHNWIQVELLEGYFTSTDRPVLLANVAAKVVESVRAAP